MANQTAYKVKWDKENTRTYKMKLMNRADSDIIEFMETIDNKQGYLKQLIRSDIARRKAKAEEEDNQE